MTATAARPVLGRAACPTPDKVRHRNQAQAVRHAWELWLKGDDMVAAYHCRCGRWHVGHDRRLTR